MKKQKVILLMLGLISALLVILFMYHASSNKFLKFKYSPHVRSTWRSALLKEGDKVTTFGYEVLGLMSGHNQARMSPANDTQTKREFQKNGDFGLFHIVTTFVPYGDFKDDLVIEGTRKPTDQEIEARMSEILDCLQRNLAHPSVAYVHTLVYHEESIRYLRMLDIANSHKLIIHRNGQKLKEKHQLAYASEYLQNKSVIITHQDNYLGEGWEKVSHQTLKKQRLMYALTRQVAPKNCSAAFKARHCGPGELYHGSHDTFVFYVSHTFPDDKLKEIDFTPNNNGIENALMWIFMEKFNYRLLNPCKALIMYHSHCVAIREKHRKKINTLETSAWAGFTDQLE